jgi:hypothetical protein
LIDYITDNFPSKVEYRASGVALTGGIRVRPAKNFHFEGRLELGLGDGELELSTIDFLWNEIQEEGYASFALIAGGYYTFSRPRLQVGLELGLQGFTGDFRIWNNAGFWSEGTVEGGGGTLNVTVGYRF